FRDAILSRGAQGPVPPRQRHARHPVAGPHLEVVEIGAMPWKEDLHAQACACVLLMMPAVEAGYAVDSGEKAVAPVVADRHHLPIGVAQISDFRVAEIVHALSDPNAVCHRPVASVADLKVVP